MTPVGRGECGSRGRGCQPRSRAAPGKKRPAGTTTGPRATSPAALGRPGVGNAHPYLVPSQEVRELELSGGVRSLPQVPWWNAGRRARPKRKGGASRLYPWRALCAACVQVVDYASAGVPLPFFICRKRPAKRVCSPDERSEIRERHKSSLIVPGYRSAHPGYRLRAVSTSLFDITRGRVRARERDRTRLHFSPRAGRSRGAKRRG